MSQAGRSDKKRNEYGDGTWYMRYNGKYVYRFRYTDEYNKRATKSVSGNTEAECFEKAEAFLKTVKRLKGEFTLDATVPEILHWKIDRDYAKNYTTESTYDRNMFVISIIENSAIGDIPIAYMTPMQVDFFLRSITHYSNAMLRKVYSMLKAAFRIAFDCRLVDVNFMTRDDMRCPRSDKPDKKVRGFTESEQTRFINALLEHPVKAGSNSYKLQLLIEMYSGMRMGEINALKPEDIDFIDGFVHVRRTVGRGMNSRPYLKEGAKTEAGVRDIPIGKLLEPVLKEALREMQPNPEGLIFYDHVKKSIISTSQVNCLFRRICEKAGLELTGQHALRHTFATRCIEAGIPALVLKNWMGHTDIHITLDTYADVFARMNAGAVEMLDTKMKDIVPVLQAGMEDDQRDLKQELYSAPYKSIGAPRKI